MNFSASSLKSYLCVALWIVIFLFIASVIGDMTRFEIPGWYRNLTKPPLNPPDIVFPIVWTTLYIMLAVAGYRLWRDRKINPPEAFPLFAVQMIMNWAWSYFFFKFHMLGFSFFWILGMIAILVFLILMIHKNDRLGTALLIPYLLWISFASYLNGMIWYLN